MKVLLAEDDPVSRALLRKVLQKAGHEVLVAKDGLEAKDFFIKNVVRLVVTDWMMPGLDGLGLCREIRSAGKPHYTYVIVLTAKDEKPDFMRAFEAGADDYISKPFDPEELLARLKTGMRIVRLEQEHQKLQGILIESRNKLRVVFDSLREQVVSVDEDLRIVSANRAFLDRNGVTFDKVIGRHCFPNGDPEVRGYLSEGTKAAVLAVFREGDPVSIEESSQDPQGEMVFREISCLPVRDDGGRVFQTTILCRDTTEERRRTQEIERLNQQVQKAYQEIKAKNERLEDALRQLKDSQAQILQSEKMASIGQLAAGVAHEINNPTGFVSSNLKTLGDYQKDITDLMEQYRKLCAFVLEKARGREDLRDLEEAVSRIREQEEEVDIDFVLGDALDLIRESQEGTERIKKIVLDLKNFAHPGTDKLQSADINGSIESTLNIVWNEIKYKATVHKDYGELPPVKCYPQQLNQVFMNLLVNAAQAMEDKGEIFISTRSDNGEVEIVIRDTGSGIPEEILPKIFDPFFTTKEVGKGTGLGLNVAYNIIKKHRGEIRVESTPGKGTAFTIRVPVEFKEPPEEEADAQSETHHVA
ncbi:MAG: response regulator [Deltaproteobacteria bacterium]|nr:response regulator [Deltaproteobacteria bacterium]